MIRRRHLFYISSISLAIHCATLVFVSVVFYPVLDELQSVMPYIKHITEPSTLEHVVLSAVRTSNVSSEVINHLSAETEDIITTFNEDLRLSLAQAETAMGQHLSTLETSFAKLVQQSEQRILAAMKQRPPV